MNPNTQEIEILDFWCSKLSHFMWSEIPVIEIHIIWALESLNMMLCAILINLGTIWALFVYFVFWILLAQLLPILEKLKCHLIDNCNSINMTKFKSFITYTEEII